MDDALLVRGFERVGDLPRDRERLVCRHRLAGNALGERLALDQLHHEGASWDPALAGPSSSPWIARCAGD